jgi:hypothetical protein
MTRVQKQMCTKRHSTAVSTVKYNSQLYGWALPEKQAKLWLSTAKKQENLLITEARGIKLFH